MATKTGYLAACNFTSMPSLGITMEANEYPKGTIQFYSYWRNSRSNASQGATVWICDSEGNNAVKLFDLNIGADSSDTSHKSATVNAPDLKGKALYLKFTNVSYPYQMHYVNGSAVEVDTTYDTFTIKCSAGTGGSLSASKSSATPGTTVKLYPSENTGYELASYTKTPSSLVTLGNKFTMPAQNVTIKANFTKTTYTITKKASPSGAGTVNGPSGATMGTSVSFTQIPEDGYYFKNWTTSPSGLGNSFTMPAQNVTVTANYLKMSVPSLNSKTLTGGSTVTMNITAEKATYTHKYKVEFDSDMQTGMIDVAAGVTSVEIEVPEEWSEEIPNAKKKTGGILFLYTYSGSTNIGVRTINGLTYAVPASAGPEISNFSADVARTIGGKTYADIGNIFTQLHCGARIQAEADCGLGASIVSMTAGIAGYSGSDFNGTAAGDSIDFTTGLLPVSGTLTVVVTATDSRGFTASESMTITVAQYNPPAGVMDVWRVDFDEQDDDVGIYARYSISKAYTQIGTNSLTVKLISQSAEEVISADTGNILPGSRQTFSLQREFQIMAELTDAFETTTITATLRSGRFILFVDAAGERLGIMQATSKTVPAGKDSTIEFSGDSQIYIGNETLEDYIGAIAEDVVEPVEEDLQDLTGDVQDLAGDVDDIINDLKTVNVSSAITPGSSYTTGDDPTLLLYASGNVRMLRAQIQPKSANADWQTICTVGSGHRPKAMVYGFFGNNASTPVLKPVRLGTDGVLEIYSRTANIFNISLTYLV